MATLTVRIDDDTRDTLDEMARDEGLNLSDYIRRLLREAVVPLREIDKFQLKARANAPETLSTQERHTLSLLHRILARVLPEDANDTDGDSDYQLERARVLEAGFTNEYWVEFAGVADELSKKNCARVMDILDMFRILDYSVDKLAEEGIELDVDVVSSLRYRGFDHNDALEGKMADYVQHLVADDKWSEREEFIKGPGSGNSHMTVLPTYQRMLDEYRRTMERRERVSRTDYLLNKDDLIAIASATVHPERRGPQ
ncbi:hypothetical protein JF66_21585 [Cryobacterium sp. MLB-32]|uniref:YfbU family protein n=1 Tax=Cryobacterium sp. MLB-32 TaxID=1529318 RepID=UPI0004E60DBE|nr:YfbU family protein [Cryobacterium sp. MLB-32]KFF58043.1 hypothetical protein JF66_21585 [Cryobacterium sp. MLB-32]